MNRFFCIGKVLKDVNYGFLVQPKVFAAADTLLEIQEYYNSKNKIIIKIKGFNNIADKMYRYLDKNVKILLVGQLLTNGYVQVINFKILEHD